MAEIFRHAQNFFLKTKTCLPNLVINAFSLPLYDFQHLRIVSQRELKLRELKDIPWPVVQELANYFYGIATILMDHR